MTAGNLILSRPYAREQRNAPEINDKSEFSCHLTAEKWQNVFKHSGGGHFGLFRNVLYDNN